MTEFTPLELSKVRTRLLMKQPFFGSLAMRLRYVADSSIGTLCTNGVEIRYSPEFMARLNDLERQAVIVHEVLHPAMLHIFRRNKRHMGTWNKACDFAINPMIEAAGLPLPRAVKDADGKVIFSGPCIDAKYKGMSAEAIYAKLRQEQQKEQEQKNGKDEKGEGDASDKGNPGADGDGSESGPGDSQQSSDDAGGNKQRGTKTSGGQSGQASTGVSENSGGSEEAPSVTGEFVDGVQDAEGAMPGDMNEQDWKIAVEQALSVSRAAGKLPGGWEEVIKADRVPKMDPWVVIEQFVDNEVQSDYSWATPNRRLIAGGVYLPGAKKENIGEMVIGLDTSGSASSAMLAEWASHISGIAQQFQPSKVHVVMCDTRVTNVATYEPSDYGDISFACKGRGGTEFQPVFDWVEKENVNPVCLIYFTDTYGPTPFEPEGYATLWAVPEYLAQNTGPFGQTVHVGVE